MSYLLESLGRGLLAHLRAAFEGSLTGDACDEIDELEERCTASPDSADLAVRLGLAYLREHRLGKAKSAFERAMRLPPASKRPALGLACVHDELGQLPEAIRCLSIAQAHDPDDPAIAFGIGYCYERGKDLNGAIANYKRATLLCPYLRNAYERIAAIAIREGDWGEAIRMYEHLAELETDDLDVLIALGTLHLQTDQPLDAVDWYQRALLIEPECVDDAEADGDFEKPDELAKAIEALRLLVRKYPAVADFQIRLGDLYAKAGDEARAVEAFRAAVDAQPNYLEATVKLGAQHLRGGRFIDAAQMFNRAVELNDRLMTAFVGLGVAQQRSGRTREADATFNLAVSLEPNSALLYSETARLQLKAEGVRSEPVLTSDRISPRRATGDDLLEEALRRHRQALVQSPGHADLHYRYGLLLRQTGRNEEAIDAFESAIEINPGFHKALIKLGICLKECGRIDAAIEVFQRTLLLCPEFVDVHYQLGLLFAQRNQFDLALEEFESAVEGNGTNVSFRANLALALQNIGMVDRAAATWNSICDLARETAGSPGRGHVLRSPRREE